MRIVYLLFGQMGAGKTFLGKRHAERIGGTFYDGDDALPPNLKAKVAACRPLTRKEVKDFVQHSLLEEILSRAYGLPSDGALVVSQALYCNADRLWLAEQLKARGLDVVFAHIQAPLIRNLKQLWGRSHGLKWIALHLLSRPWFEPPSHFCVELKED